MTTQETRQAKRRHKELTAELRIVTDKIAKANVTISNGRRRLARLNVRRDALTKAISSDIPMGIVSVSSNGRTGQIIQIDVFRPAMLAELIELALKARGKRIQIPRIGHGQCSYEVPSGKSFEVSIHKRLKDLGCMLSETQVKRMARAPAAETGTVFVSSAGTVQPFLKFPSGKKPRVTGRSCSVLQNRAGKRPVRYTEHLQPGSKVFMLAPAA